MNETVEEKLKLLPDKPGVYIMKNEQGKIIYVGKAVVLKNRVRQYFQSNKNHTPKVRAMVSHIADFEIIMTHSEVEALILECNLIKKHRPRYNISLKDDKSYPGSLHSEVIHLRQSGIPCRRRWILLERILRRRIRRRWRTCMVISGGYCYQWSLFYHV